MAGIQAGDGLERDGGEGVRALESGSGAVDGVVVGIEEGGGERGGGVRADGGAGDGAEGGGRLRRLVGVVDLGGGKEGGVGPHVAEGVAEAFIQRLRWDDGDVVAVAAGEADGELADAVAHGGGGDEPKFRGFF